MPFILKVMQPAKNSLQTVKSRIDAFIENYGDLRFEVTKDRLLYKSEPVQQDDPKIGTLAEVNGKQSSYSI